MSQYSRNFLNDYGSDMAYKTLSFCFVKPLLATAVSLFVIDQEGALIKTRCSLCLFPPMRRYRIGCMSFGSQSHYLPERQGRHLHSS